MLRQHKHSLVPTALPQYPENFVWFGGGGWLGYIVYMLSAINKTPGHNKESTV